ncbi:hypothetical protein D1BOALGB6SA_2316 [Olavius sp. associated proteobacterium Delta 1]|nr:hypothetical protein D1BOALGB6SA_2316 [Olavius sp. associated proteobacterium Delta 1]
MEFIPAFLCWQGLLSISNLTKELIHFKYLFYDRIDMI